MRPPAALPDTPDWLDLGAKLEDLEAMRSLVVEEDVAIEVGSYVGRTALALLEAGASEVYCVDTWEGGADEKDEANRLYQRHGSRVFETFCRNAGDAFLFDIFPLVGTSLQWAKVWPFKVDLVYLDASHDYDSVKADIEAWWPHVEEGGILCGHDFDPYWSGVMRAVEESGPFEVVKGTTVWYRRKP